MNTETKKDFLEERPESCGSCKHFLRSKNEDETLQVGGFCKTISFALSSRNACINSDICLHVWQSFSCRFYLQKGK